MSEGFLFSKCFPESTREHLSEARRSIDEDWPCDGDEEDWEFAPHEQDDPVDLLSLN